jgi:hypothetical protein
MLRRGGAAFIGALLLPAIFMAPLRADQVYRSVDADGHVVYSDHAMSAAAQKTDIHVNRPAPEEVAQYVKEQEILKAEDNQRRKQQAAEMLRKAQADHAKEVQCDAARTHFFSVKDARRISERDADGNRFYISDTDAQTKRDEALQAMLAACGP